ncbi:hypothetical protein EVAR_51258_1 [Eumeta japonica]|uniref:Uncharacterized protein n=1 Tax=Eumeta variegata TaxID=151549 RepID=A0A4C1X4W2_EUMVA|nr:hypothetical protein EVAR_51258_1 [Eumeta japonica]
MREYECGVRLGKLSMEFFLYIEDEVIPSPWTHEKTSAPTAHGFTETRLRVLRLTPAPAPPPPPPAAFPATTPSRNTSRDT